MKNNNNNGDKFELIKDDTCDACSNDYYRDLYRLRALRDFGRVKKGDLGGYVYDEANLSHEGNCWVFDKARVTQYGVRVSENAQIGGNAVVFGGIIRGNARIDGDAKVGGDVLVEGHAHITGKANVSHAWGLITGSAKLCGNVRVSSNPLIESGTYSTGVINSTPKKKPKRAASLRQRGPRI